MNITVMIITLGVGCCVMAALVKYIYYKIEERQARIDRWEWKEFYRELEREHPHEPMMKCYWFTKADSDNPATCENVVRGFERDGTRGEEGARIVLVQRDREVAARRYQEEHGVWPEWRRRDYQKNIK